MHLKPHFMARHRLTAPLFCLILLSCIGAPAWGDTVYELAPVSLSSGFAITGGHITTDGTTGPTFSAANILDYEISVQGPFDFTFRPTNAGARAFNVDPELVVTANEIFLPALPVGEYGELRFESRVQLDPLASFFNQQIFWGQGGSPTQTSQAGFISVSFGGGMQLPTHGQGTFSTPMRNKFVIASVNAVPEPTANLILITGLGGLLAKRRRISG